MQFLDAGAATVSQNLGRSAFGAVLLERPERPRFSLAAAVREQQIAGFIAAAHYTPVVST